ncbi:MAG TPA: hypothetical protein H9874_06025 [Candidatus Bilophila faecipullorum]|uniref:Uncharacterized protein n=2 Tax=Bilophila TaxID=35832 RepID=A0A9D1R0I4_9BACT|nr:hypothetical protein [uncultured Bilophila sp.]HIW78684.1 hypothetical protein [Candidatus Bilophila faecipullorum]
MIAETGSEVWTGSLWDALFVLAILAAAWFAGRGIASMKRPVCRRACAGCHGARQGRGCAFPPDAPSRLIDTARRNAGQ